MGVPDFPKIRVTPGTPAPPCWNPTGPISYPGSYVCHDTIVYGTGWRYQPWVSPYYYYPRFNTWGFHVGYNEWGGWDFGLNWYRPSYSLDGITGAWQP